MQLKMKGHKLMVTAEKGFAIYDIEDFYENHNRDFPLLMYQEFGKKAYGLDVIQNG